MKQQPPQAGPQHEGGQVGAILLDLARRHTRDGRLEEARALLLQLLAREPAHSVAGDLLVHLLIRLGDFAALRTEIGRRLDADPSFEHVELERSQHSLLLGDMPLGWEQYEARWELPGLDAPMRGLTQPRWNGEPFRDRTLLLHWEQGLGDTLMFVRYAPLVKALGGRVLLAAQAPLADLVATCPGIDEVIPEGAPLPPFELLLPLMSLPRVFRTGLDSIPATVPYLDVPAHVPSRQGLAQALAASEGKARVGVAWAGSAEYSNDANRSMPGGALAPLGSLPDVAWYSLQFDQEPAPLPGIVSLQPLLRDFSDTAYALSGMDLVITVDTVIAHLAGAMGIPTFLLLPSFPDWRWMLGRDDSPWYPSMRLYRQTLPGDWGGVIQRVLRDLGQREVRMPESMDPQALLDQAIQHEREQRPEEARQAYEACLALVPDHVDVWVNYGALLLGLSLWEEALAACQKALEFAPGYAPARVNLAHALVGLGRLDEAEFRLRPLLLREPRNTDALLALSDVYMKRKDWPRARKTLEELLEMQPSKPPAQARLNNVLIHQRDWLEIRKGWEGQLQAFSGPELEYERCLLDLRFGVMPEAWDGFEKRLLVPGRIRPARSFSQPKWGGEPFVGRTLLVHYEQGLGDTLMFVRYLPQVKALGGTVILLVQPRLVDLVATCRGADRIIGEGAPLPPFDLQVSLMSLPAVFRTDLSSIPVEIPYLGVPEQVPHREGLTELLAMAQARGKARIGLAWAGNPDHRLDTERSLPASDLAPLATLPNVAWFSFQLGRQELPPLPDLIPLGPLVDNMPDTAFALSGMDLLITVDTSLAHLAGALGVPTLLLLAFQPDWRWMLEREDTPWYPTLHLYRQPLPGDWGDVIQRVLADLSQNHTACTCGDDWNGLRVEMMQAVKGRTPEIIEYQRSYLSLLFGEMPRGWDEYEVRFRIPGHVTPVRDFTQPRWCGEPFPGKTLLLHFEQGYGDTFMFIRYAPLVKARGGRVIVLAQKRLADVIATCPGIDEVIPDDKPLPTFDLQLSLLSLPQVFRTDLGSIPCEIPYLDVPERVPYRQEIAGFLAASQGRVRIGCSWAGSPNHKRDRERSIPPEVFAKLGSIPDVAWYGIQFGLLTSAPLPGITSLAPVLQNFSDTAYSLSGMDMVITVDTALAHLAGAMGIPTLLLLHFQPDFRWLLHRGDSPWYPTVRIYRQPRPGDWDSVIRQVVCDLTQTED